jgi:hypothetical protein
MKVRFDGVEGAVAAVADVGAGGGKEGVQLGMALCVRQVRRLAPGVVVGGKSFDLFDVEDRVALHVGDFDFLVLPGFFVGFGPGQGVGVNDKAAALAFPDLRAQLVRLFVGHPDAARRSLFPSP